MLLSKSGFVKTPKVGLGDDFQKTNESPFYTRDYLIFILCLLCISWMSIAGIVASRLNLDSIETKNITEIFPAIAAIYLQH